MGDNQVRKYRLFLSSFLFLSFSLLCFPFFTLLSLFIFKKHLLWKAKVLRMICTKREDFSFIFYSFPFLSFTLLSFLLLSFLFLSFLSFAFLFIERICSVRLKFCVTVVPYKSSHGLSIVSNYTKMLRKKLGELF